MKNVINLFFDYFVKKRKSVILRFFSQSRLLRYFVHMKASDPGSYVRNGLSFSLGFHKRDEIKINRFQSQTPLTPLPITKNSDSKIRRDINLILKNFPPHTE